MKISYALVLAMVALLCSPCILWSGIPCVSTSTIEAEGAGTPACNPSTAVVCPAGDMGHILVTVTTRDCYGSPLPDVGVTCYPYYEDGFCFCLGEDSKSGITDVNGEVFLTFAKFGGCGDLEFYAEAFGVVIGPSLPVFIAGPDKDGTCVVNLSDFSSFASSFLTSDPCFDFNCDGIVDLSDFGGFASHEGIRIPLKNVPILRVNEEVE